MTRQSIKIKTWFGREARLPLLGAAVVTVLVIGALLSALAVEERSHQNQTLQRLSELATAGLAPVKNRSLIEQVFEIAVRDLSARRTMLCRNGLIEVAFPPRDADCRSRPETGTFRITMPAAGMSDFVFYFDVPLIPRLHLFAGLGVVALLFVVLLSLVLIRMSRKIHEDILDPLQLAFSSATESTSRPGPEFRVAEIEGLFETHLAKLAEISRLGEENARNAQFAAIAQTTQMVAHDVRKPFSMLKNGLELLADVQTVDDVRLLSGRLLPQVKRAMGTVQGMLQDIMEVGGKSLPKPEPTPVDVLVDSALGDVFRERKKTDIDFTFEWNHVHKLAVDPRKLQRVLVNIIDNAVDAMDAKGRIWITSHERIESDRTAMEICLGNDGPVLPDDALSKLFTAFYTDGKKSGTGLGLAIAQKIVAAHGGTIWCTSSAEHGTEFRMTLPVSPEMSPTALTLPAFSQGYEAPSGRQPGSVSDTSRRSDVDEVSAIERTLQEWSQNGRPRISAFVIDDEISYVERIKATLGPADRLGHLVDWTEASSSGEAFASVQKGVPDVIFCDVDLGRGSLDGYAIIRELRRQGVKSLVCVHSNRALEEDAREAMAAGADLVIPKPICRNQLLRVLAQVMTIVEPDGRGGMRSKMGATHGFLREGMRGLA